jgi:hypothetical protein
MALRALVGLTAALRIWLKLVPWWATKAWPLLKWPPENVWEENLGPP